MSSFDKLVQRMAEPDDRGLIPARASFELVPVAPEDLDSVWVFVQPGLKQIVSEYSFDWKPEHVYVGILSGGTTLWVAREDDRVLGSVAGFVQPIQCTNKKEFFIWALAGIGTKPGMRELIHLDAYKTETINYLIAYAKGLGCSRLHTLSTHKALEKWGFKARQIDYVLPLE